MNKSFKLFASAALSLAVAGTCLAAPAFAAGDSSALGSALDAVARAAEQAGTEQAPSAPGADESDTLISLGTHINFAGIAFDVPEGYTDDEDPSDDVSRLGQPGLFQGYNSAAKRDPEFGVGYEGPCPPNADHVYTMHAVALDVELDLAAPFWANELVQACRGHVLGEAVTLLPSRS